MPFWVLHGYNKFRLQFIGASNGRVYQVKLVKVYGCTDLPNPLVPERPRVEIVSAKNFFVMQHGVCMGMLHEVIFCS